MDGVVLVCRSTGSMIYHRSFHSSNFGFPVSKSDEEELIMCRSCKCRHTDDLQLGALIFAILTYSKTVVSGDVDACAIKSYSVGSYTTMYFNVHPNPALDLLCVTFVSSSLSEEIGSEIGRATVESFGSLYSVSLLDAMERTHPGNYRNFYKHINPMVIVPVLKTSLFKLQEATISFFGEVNTLPWLAVARYKNNSSSSETKKQATKSSSIGSNFGITSETNLDVSHNKIDAISVVEAATTGKLSSTSTIAGSSSDERDTKTKTKQQSIQNGKRKWWQLFGRRRKLDPPAITTGEEDSSSTTSKVAPPLVIATDSGGVAKADVTNTKTAAPSTAAAATTIDATKFVSIWRLDYHQHASSVSKFADISKFPADIVTEMEMVGKQVFQQFDRLCVAGGGIVTHQHNRDLGEGITPSHTCTLAIVHNDVVLLLPQSALITHNMMGISSCSGGSSNVGSSTCNEATGKNGFTTTTTTTNAHILTMTDVDSFIARNGELLRLVFTILNSSVRPL